MTPFVFMILLLHVSAESRQYAAVYGLPELARDILERIKAATGQPIDTNRFMQLTASAKRQELLEHLPYTITSQYQKGSKGENLDKGHYNLNEQGKDSGKDKERFFEIFTKEDGGNELAKHDYDDSEGTSHKYNEERYIKTNHHDSHGGRKGGKFKKGRKRGKFHVEKGFRDIYHKDEEKKSDFFWNNQHEEGKWLEYGFTNRKREKSQDKGEDGKEESEESEESSYEKKENKCAKCKT